MQTREPRASRPRPPFVLATTPNLDGDSLALATSRSIFELIRLRTLYAEWGRETSICVRCEPTHADARYARANGVERVVRDVRAAEVQAAAEYERTRGVPREVAA